MKCKLINYYLPSHILMEKEVSVSAPLRLRFLFLKTSWSSFPPRFFFFGWVPFIYIIDKAAPDCSNDRCVALLLRLTLVQTTTQIRCDEASSSLCAQGVKPEKSAGPSRGTGFKSKAVLAVKAPYFPGEMDRKVFSELRFHSKGKWNIDMLVVWIRHTHQQQLHLYRHISAVWGLN